MYGSLHRQKTVISAVKFKKPIKKLQNRHFILKNKKLLELDPLKFLIYKKTCIEIVNTLETIYDVINRGPKFASLWNCVVT